MSRQHLIASNAKHMNRQSLPSGNVGFAPDHPRTRATVRRQDHVIFRNREPDADARPGFAPADRASRGRDQSLDTSADDSGDQRPSGVRTPNQLSRTC